MKIKINRSIAKGTITAPPSKSMAHRMIICAALCDGVSVIENVDLSQDIEATIDCIKTLGAKVSVKGNSVTVDGSDTVIQKFVRQDRKDSDDDLNNMSDKTDISDFNFFCRESGSTMRFFMGIAMALPLISEFHGSETLLNRPFGIYEKILNSDKASKENVFFEKKDDRIVIRGGIDTDSFEVEGNISSQFITGLLFAVSLKGKGGVIKLIPPVESRSYINLTLQSLKCFGTDADWLDENTLKIEADSHFVNRTISVEGDYSNAAFLDAFTILGGSVNVEGLNENSLQGDKVYKDYFEKLSKEKATLDIADCPDLGPVLFAVAAAKHGGMFTSTARLKIKESDRAGVMCEELAKFGVKTIVKENSVEICEGNLSTPECEIEGHNDHRIVMSLSLLLTLTGGVINEAEAVRKSYPGFFDDIEKLGIVFEKIS
ncbi:MAG: 3-phosphoshikimate 1-carboxyvinyltransferase [Lachnospiraceae bacterium]|nr:3-phosphoshikimate 1-carboxyvinyltransferase [Lachnospiraceae bacterium]